MEKIFNNMKIYIFMLFMFTRSVTNGLFLESSGTLLDTTQLATSTINSQSGTLSRPKTSLHLSSSILSASHDTILKTSSTIHMKNSHRLTASKTESVQNSHARTQKKESTVLVTKLSTEPITMTIPEATSSKTLSPSKTVFTPTSIQPTSSLEMADSSSKSFQSNIPKSVSSLEHSAMPIPSSTGSSTGKLDSTETLITSSTITMTTSHQSLPSTLGTGIVNSYSSVLQENKSQSKGILRLASANHLQSSSTPVLFHPPQSSDFSQFISSSFHSSISPETTRKMPESSHVIKSSISPSSVQFADSSLRLSTVQSNQNSMSFSKPVDLETSSYFSSVMTTSQINGTKILAASILKTSANILSSSPIPDVSSSQSDSLSTTELSRSFQLLTPSPTVQILNTKWNSSDTVSVFPSSSVFANKSSAIFQPFSPPSADWMKTYTYSSIELSSTLITTGVIASMMSPSLSSGNVQDLQLSTSSSSEIQETLFPSTSAPGFWPKGSETLVSSRRANQSLVLLTASAAHQENTTVIPTSTMVNKTGAFLVPTIYIKPTTSTLSASKFLTPHSKTTIIPSSSSEKSQNHSTMSNDLPTNPTTTRVVHTTETMYYPTHRISQKYNATIELTFNGQCEPLHTRRTYQHFVDNVQTLICKKLRVTHEHVIVHNLTCASVHIHVTFLNITTANLTGNLQSLIDRKKMNVTVYGDRQELHYEGTALKMVPFPTSITEILARSEEKNTEVVVIIIASTIIILLLLVGLIVFGRECYRRKRSQTFDLTNTPHVHLKMEDFTLTRIPRTGAWYSDEGVTIQRFSETNGNSIVKSSNGVRKQPAISCISDMLREKDSSGAHLRQFSYTILPSNRKDSQDTTVSTASDGNFRHSTDSLVARQNSNMHGAVNPIYLGDEYPRLLPSGQADQRSDLVNGQRDNKAIRRK